MSWVILSSSDPSQRQSGPKMSCIFCDAFLEDGQPTFVLRQKGCDAINALAHTLGLAFTVIPGQTVHTVCRRDFCRQKELRRSKIPDQNLKSIDVCDREVDLTLKHNVYFADNSVKLVETNGDLMYFQFESLISKIKYDNSH
ncbi:hypothetical protein DPMN_080509 [Dreissena polymorpha]|uniref:Uncharacterized protein n=1 Tax=Dreissena polymorpha TaxID=45954 RepID=A0A9D4BRU3_DREPO|nr:hypothetical protein DPMN_080509 [Dreissena polymorpha]